MNNTLMKSYISRNYKKVNYKSITGSMQIHIHIHKFLHVFWSRACRNVASDLSLGGGFEWVLRFPLPLITLLVTTWPQYGRKSNNIQNSEREFLPLPFVAQWEIFHLLLEFCSTSFQGEFFHQGEIFGIEIFTYRQGSNHLEARKG